MAIWEDPFAKLSEDLTATFRPQREWVSRRGVWLILGHFLSGAGAGAWLFALWFDYPAGLAIALALAALGGAAHLVFLGHPERFWRIATRPQSSWISRGLLSITLFLLCGGFYALLGYLPRLPWTPDSPLGRLFLGLSLLGAVGILVYKGFVFAVSRAIPFWNTPLLPPLYIAYALRGGVAVLFLAAAAGVSGLEMKTLELIKLWVVVSSAALILIYLAGMNKAGVAARRSVAELLGGRASLAFYLGVVGVGIAVPLGVGLFSYFTPVSMAVLGVVAVASLAGDFYVKYCVARAGIYLPVAGEFPAK